MIDVKASGAVGDGLTDDTAAVAAALSAGAGGLVYFPPGHYLVSGPLTVPLGTTIYGLGDASVVLAALGAGGILFQFAQSAAGVTVRDLAIRQATGFSGAIGLDTNRGTEATILRVSVGGPFKQGVLVNRGERVRVEDCHFQGIGVPGTSTPGDAVIVFKSQRVDVTNNRFRSCLQDCCYFSTATDCTFTGNSCLGMPEGVQARVDCARLTIAGNVFEVDLNPQVNTFGIILQTGVSDCVISGNVLRCASLVQPPAPVPLQTAIWIDDASHRNQIVGNTIVGEGFSHGIRVETTGGPTRTSLHTTISGNTITNPGGTGILAQTGEHFTTIQGNTIRGGANKAILVGGDDCPVVGNTVRDNTGYDGITIRGSRASVVRNTVTGVKNRAGILLDGTGGTASHCVVMGNVCRGNNTHGIHEQGQANWNTIEHNDCTGNLHASLDIVYVGANTIARNNQGRYTPN